MRASVDDLAQMHCRPLGPEAAMSAPQVESHLGQVAGWAQVGETIRKRFAFADFHRTMAFVNAVARIAHEQDHHPELAVGYDSCTVAFGTHSAGGLTLNDFICAARVDALREAAASA